MKLCTPKSGWKEVVQNLRRTFYMFLMNQPHLFTFQIDLILIDWSLQVGPFTLSLSALIVSIYGILTVYPVCLLIIWIFKKTKPKPTKEEIEDAKELAAVEEKLKEEEKLWKENKGLLKIVCVSLSFFYWFCLLLFYQL